ncbi:hypothetical protein [Bacteroides thetaiotaomicron]|uniref:hypothetical protein n=1 Tax=Bacteroides thetaiotaomicron TaxID=818 RepID=UPI0021645A28|nr:hypothetical protein [Bacteroides thetaiotaomicron]UVQ25937.1 hypothetical protein NXW82_18980 [Bacteroides thetaiotaomicron]
MATELIKIDEAKNILSSFPDIMGKNTNSVKKCNEAGQALLDTIEGEGMNETIDQATADYLKKVSVTLKNMDERRKPITQIFDRIRSFFTSQEKQIDPKDPSTIPGKLVIKRNEYAKFKYEEEQKRKREAEQRARIETEKANYRQIIGDSLLFYFNQYLSSKVSELQGIFSNLTYENFDREVIGITVFQTDYPKSHFDKFCADSATYYISQETKKEIRRNVLEGKYEQYAQQYKAKIVSVKQDLTDRIPSKRKELAELEQLRLANAEEAAKAEELRKQREKEAATKRMEELKKEEEAAKQEAALKAQQSSIGSLFMEAAASIAPPPTNAKVKEKIVVLHQQGYLEIFQMWWINEGQTLPVEELEKIFKKMITYCEKQANGKDQKHIESKFIRYEADVKAK